MQRTLKRSDRADQRRDDVRAGRGDDASGERRRVQAMINDGVQIGVQCSNVLGIGTFTGQHVEIVGCFAKIRVGHNGWLPGQHPSVERDDRWNAGDKAEGVIFGIGIRLAS